MESVELIAGGAAVAGAAVEGAAVAGKAVTAAGTFAGGGNVVELGKGAAMAIPEAIAPEAIAAEVAPAVSEAVAETAPKVSPAAADNNQLETVRQQLYGPEQPIIIEQEKDPKDAKIEQLQKENIELQKRVAYLQGVVDSVVPKKRAA